MFYLSPEGDRYSLGRAFNYYAKDDQGNFLLEEDGSQALFQYPASRATSETFLALGFTEVTTQPRPNDTFYAVTGPDNTGAYTATPRDLDQLKAQFKFEQKQQAHTVLRQTDWYVIRSQELGVVAAAVPANISSFRAAYRAAADARCAEIDACTTVQELENIFLDTIPTDPTDPGSTYVANPNAMTPFPDPLEEAVNYYS